VAERHAAVHAARALLAQLGDRPRDGELVVVAQALERVALLDRRTADPHEASELAHQAGTSDVRLRTAGII
jgi:hypothetical protein